MAANGIIGVLLIAASTLALPDGFQRQTVLTDDHLGSTMLMQIVFFPDDQQRCLLLDKNGQIFIGQSSGNRFETKLYMTLPTYSNDEVGLVSILIEDEESWKRGNKKFYVYHSDAGGNAMRISKFDHQEKRGGIDSRGVFNSKSELWVDSDGIPAGEEQHSGKDVHWHYGGQMQWGPDGHIYLTLGDKYQQTWAQRADKYAGCVIRITKDGGIPAGNLPSYKKPEACWAYGGRNLYRGHWDIPGNGLPSRYIVAEVGSNDHSKAAEDVHIVDQGDNLGWPFCEGSCENSKFPQCKCNRHDDPVYTYDHNNTEACLIGGLTYRGAAFPTAYQGAYFFGDYVKKHISYLTFTQDGGRTVENVHVFDEDGGAVLYFTTDRQGNMWYIKSPFNWKLMKISHAGANSVPVIDTVTAQLDGSTVLLQATASDMDGGDLAYSWVIKAAADGADFPTIEVVGQDTQHTFALPGEYLVQLAVSDGAFSTTSEFIELTIGAPPQITVEGPGGLDFVAGQSYSLEAVATDLLDGDLSESIVWTVGFMHNTHFHPYGSTVVGSNITIEIPASGHSFTEYTGFRFAAVVVNRFGIPDEAEFIIHPLKATTTFDTTPFETTISFHETTFMAPATFAELVGFDVELSLPEVTCYEGVSYGFDHWEASSGGMVDPLDRHGHYTVSQENTRVVGHMVLLTIGGSSTEARDCEAIYRINCGGEALIDQNGLAWEVDEPYVNQDETLPSVTPDNGEGARGWLDVRYNDLLLNERYMKRHGTRMEYAFNVSEPGKFLVRLIMKEGYYHNVGQRVFSVNVQGEPWIVELDIFAEAGHGFAVEREILVDAETDILVDFLRVVENPVVHGIIITREGTSAPTSSPTWSPTLSPTTAEPTWAPTPSAAPTSSEPTAAPTSSRPTAMPSMSPTATPTTSNPTLAPSTAPTFSPTSFLPVLWDARDAIELYPLYTGQTLSIANIGTDALTVIVGFPAGFTGSLIFNIDDDSTKNGALKWRKENNPPYALLGDRAGVIFNPWTAEVGAHSIAFQCWSEKNSRGDLVYEHRTTFDVVNVLITDPPTTAEPTSDPTPAPTPDPTSSPSTSYPTVEPTVFPTTTPTLAPSPSPSLSPTAAPTRSPTTAEPTTSPTPPPTPAPTMSPSPSPTTPPTLVPLPGPTPSPTPSPTPLPTTSKPTPAPWEAPTTAPSSSPSPSPTPSPTSRPTSSPSPSPTTSDPTPAPSPLPTGVPTTSDPTFSPTPAPTLAPTAGGFLLLVNAVSNVVLQPLREGMTVSTANVGTNKVSFVVDETLFAAAAIGSVRFFMDSDYDPHVENKAPFSLRGDRTRNGVVNYKPWSASLGVHHLRVQVWSAANANGELLGSQEATFVVTDALLTPTAPPVAPPTGSLPTPVPTASPTEPPPTLVTTTGEPTPPPSLLPSPAPTPAPSLLPSPAPTPAPSLLPSPAPTPAPTGKTPSPVTMPSVTTPPTTSPSTTPQQGTGSGLEIFDATSDAMLYPLVDGMLISTSDIGHNKITVVVGNAAEAAFPIRSVLFYMDDDLSPAIENRRPYSFKGDRKRGGSTNYKPWSASTGTHRLRVEYWQGTYGSGSLLHSIDVTFTVVDHPLTRPEFIHADLNRETTATAVPDGASGQSAAIATAVVVLAVVLVIGAAIVTGRPLRSRQAGEAENNTFVQHGDCIDHSPAEPSPAAAAEMNAIQAEDDFVWDDMMLGMT